MNIKTVKNNNDKTLWSLYNHKKVAVLKETHSMPHKKEEIVNWNNLCSKLILNNIKKITFTADKNGGNYEYEFVPEYKSRSNNELDDVTTSVEIELENLNNWESCLVVARNFHDFLFEKQQPFVLDNQYGEKTIKTFGAIHKMKCSLQRTDKFGFLINIEAELQKYQNNSFRINPDAEANIYSHKTENSVALDIFHSIIRDSQFYKFSDIVLVFEHNGKTDLSVRDSDLNPQKYPRNLNIQPYATDFMRLVYNISHNLPMSYNDGTDNYQNVFFKPAIYKHPDFEIEFAYISLADKKMPVEGRLCCVIRILSIKHT